MKTRQDNDHTSCHDWSDGMSSETKTRQDSYVIDHTSTIYAENDTKLSWPIGLVVDYDKN